MKSQNILVLLQKYKEGKCTPEETAWLESWYLKHTPDAIGHLTPVEFEEDLRLIGEGLPLQNPKSTRSLWPRIAAAASVIFILSVGGYWILHKNQAPSSQQIAVQKTPADFAPGGNKAVLTLANGKHIVLNGTQNGMLAVQGKTAINKTADGMITYNSNAASAQSTDQKNAYNTMATPRGGQYHLVLTDGTNVWLNAASSITYPATFTGDSREVKLSGEAYFEVAHNPLKPFRVLTNGQMVEVLGTHFNISAYTDEGSVKTDLLEGSVKIARNDITALLRPGQEAFTSDKPGISVKDADVQASVDWKNGLFSFQRADLKTVMRQISRWYDVEVVYDGPAPSTAITGTVGRNANASQVLQILSSLDVPFKIDGRKIIIMHN